MVVDDLVVEDREVESEAKANGVAWVKSLGELVSLIICFKCTILYALELVLGGRLGNISVIIADHLLEEGLGLVLSCKLEAFVLNGFYDSHAFIVQL